MSAESKVLPDIPKIHGYYTYDPETKKCSTDASGLRVLKPNFARILTTERPIHTNLELTTGYKRDLELPRYEFGEEFSLLLKNLTEKVYDFEVGGFQFVTSRGTLSQIMARRFIDGKVKILAQKFGDTIYIKRDDVEEITVRFKLMDSYSHCMSFCGYSFPHLVTDPYDGPDCGDAPSHEPGTAPSYKRFSCLFEITVGGNRILYDGTMNALVGSYADLKDPRSYTDLKTKFTHIMADTYKGQRDFPKWWCNLYLSGSEKLICGLRTKNHWAKELRVYSRQEMEKKYPFDGAELFTYLDSILENIKEQMADKKPSDVVVFTIPKSGSIGQEVYSEKDNPEKFEKLRLLDDDFMQAFHA